ncbi:DUF4139 domain-containing protein [Geothrix campi]|uniref:DUF4139 domain-containing protein n=1 Tax=Geothrix campi TaxID=2966450 RepID=UPI0021472EB7|nr:DUF4139 domain-containing protein [Geothrix sp. SG10]
MRTLLIFFTLVLAPLQGQSPEIRTTAKDRTALSVTIYQNGLAAVRDTRRVSLPAGLSRLAFADLLPTLRPKSATLLDPGNEFQVRERNFEFNLLSPASLVDASLGLPVRIKGEEGKSRQEGTLVSVPLLNPRFRPDAKPLERIARKASAYAHAPDPGVVVSTSEGLRIGGSGQVSFLNLPSALRPSPTLLQDISLPAASDAAVTLLYTATDFTWNPFYIATIASDGRHMDLDVLATVKNQSGGELPGTLLQLVAGAPNMVYDPPPSDQNTPQVDKTETKTAVVVEVLASAPVFREEKLSEYPLFTLDRPVTLVARSEKQLRLMAVEGIPIHQRLLVQAPYEAPDTTPSGFLEGSLFKEREDSDWYRHPRVHRTAMVPNTTAMKLGRALPGGDLLIRYRDPVGGLVILQNEASAYLSEFPGTPPGEEIELDFGLARGLYVERRGLDTKREPVGWLARLWLRESPAFRWKYRVEVRVRSVLAHSVALTVREPLPADWKIIRANHSGHRSGGSSWDFTIEVPPHGEVLLTYEALTSPEERAASKP